MDHIPHIETISYWLLHYGSLVLFILLALGIIALPIPEETLMVLSGVLMSQGKLYIIPTIIAALAGSITGISVSYLLGRTAGHYVILKYGGWLGITQKQLDIAHQWFEKYGTWTLLIGYFIPGLRHFTGFSAGTTNLEYSRFSLFAYSGALLWVSTFLSIGYFFGMKWLDYLQNVISIDDIIVSLLVIAVCFAIYKLKKID